MTTSRISLNAPKQKVLELGQQETGKPFLVRWLVRLLIVAVVLAGCLYTASFFFGSIDGELADVSTFVVSKRKLVDTVIEQGTLESQSKVEGVCELHGWQNKITFIVDEGAQVAKGDVVVKFDASEIETALAQQRISENTVQAEVDEAKEQIEVQTNKNESDIAVAKLEKVLAELDLEKYKEGDYKAELADFERSIAESKAALEQRTEELKNMRILVKKGYREPERLRQMEQTEKSARFQVERDEQKKEVLTKYTFKRQITELESNADEAGRKLTRAVATAKAELSKAKLKLVSAEQRLKIEQKEVKEYEEQVEKTEIKATQSGTVAYANTRWMSDQYRIRPGGSVHRGQTVFHLPDMSRMQVQLDVHESLINKLAVGQRAIVRVDSFPDQKFTGKIKKIADLARSDGRTEAKKYTAIVLIDGFPENIQLKPGMTAETEIHVRTLKDVVAIPVQTVTQIAGSEYAYIKRSGEFKRTLITVADGNESFLVLNDGLNVGDEIAMDAYQRGLTDIDAEGLEQASTDDSDFASTDIADTSSDSDESPNEPDAENDANESLAENDETKPAAEVESTTSDDEEQTTSELPGTTEAEEISLAPAANDDVGKTSDETGED